MAVGKFKLAFLALAIVCLTQNAATAPRAQPAGEKLSVPPEVEIVGRAVSDIVKSFSEFLRSVAVVVAHSAAEAMVKFGVPLYAKAHLILTASGVQDASLTFTDQQHLEYRLVARTVLRLRQKLDLMERFEEVFDSILADVAASTLAAKPKAESSPAEFLSRVILDLTETTNRRLRQHPELREAYQRIRETVRVEDAEITPTVLDFSKMGGSGERLVQSLPEEVRRRMLTPFVNKQFLHHTLNRITIFKKEYFVLARSTLELAKKPNKIETVQQVYDKTVGEVSSYLDSVKADTFDISKGLFKELKSNFEANPSLNYELREMQKYVSQRHEWDTNIWDLDLMPF